MAQRPGSHRADHASPLVDLDVVFADDRLIDSIAGVDPVTPEHADPGPVDPRPVDPGPVDPGCVDHAAGPAGRHSAGLQPAGPFGRGRHLVHTQHSGRPAIGTVDGPDSADPLTVLFQTWRYELASEPLPPVPSVYRAADAVVIGREQRKRSLRPALSIAAAIAALLIGSATVGSKEADQDSALWGITQVLWPDRAESVASRDHVRQALDEATVALAAGDTQQAQLALLRAAVELGRVADVDGKGGMQQQVDELWRAAAPRELSGTSLTADPMTEQMLADGLPASARPSVPSPSTSVARQSLSSPSAAAPAVAPPAGRADLAGSAVTADVVQSPSPQQPVILANPADVAPSGAGGGPISGSTGGDGVSSAGTVVAEPPAGPSAEPVIPPPTLPPSPVDPPPVTVAPVTPTPPVAVEPPPTVDVSADPISTAPSTIGTTAPAPAPAPTTTGIVPTDVTSTTTTTPTASGGSDPLPQSPEAASPAG